MTDTSHGASPAPDEIERRLAEIDRQAKDASEPILLWHGQWVSADAAVYRTALRAVLVAEGEARSTLAAHIEFANQIAYALGLHPDEGCRSMC